jgi:hypothetical protein
MPVLEGIGEKKDSQGRNCLAEDFFILALANSRALL